MKPTTVVSPREGVCEQCGATDELAPVGEDYAWICTTCGERHRERTLLHMRHLIYDRLLKIDGIEEAVVSLARTNPIIFTKGDGTTN